MADRSDKDDERSEEDLEKRPQDPFVERLRPDPSEPPTRVMVLEGLLGDSDRAGFRRLYFTSELDHYAEFRADQVLSVETLPADRPPFLGQEATRVTLPRDATVDYTRTRTARPVDEFDLDVRLGPAGGMIPGPGTWEAECPGPTWGECPTFVTCVSCPDTCQITICRGRTCIDVNTCDFELCRTQSPMATCRRTCETCRTRCDTCVTCATCETQCETCTPTCITCPTGCGETCTPTCRQTCAPTCSPVCITRDLTCETCLRTQCDTCFTCTPRCPTAFC
jgi:hypothetical protein